ncbi:mitochondrial sodium/calcium exchanger protein-like isoform X2 [Scaptodrosophila lebanonensis]|uniref:Mitochondrial sodium/calcium exchanger protein-like isoform X2 n=1 Tax=Drosophila lebanonensis TaxID=7225 RepID=A0A6J2UGP4_DROLE|nr:mitochondrial sodium/calcium exchanger protein-like isoform X2 [Scaptodrosophila lebanonensis]
MQFCDELVGLCIGHKFCALYAVDVLCFQIYGPALKVVSRLLHMNEHLAGVTLLAFGNTSPDLFANLANIEEEVPVFANSMSTALFVSMFTGGLVCYISPFKMNSHSTIRDLLFFILGISLLEYVMASEGQVTLNECIMLCMVYIFYLMVNMLDLYIMRITMRMMEREIKELRSKPLTREMTRKLNELQRKYDDLNEDETIEIVERTSSIFVSGKRSQRGKSRATFTFGTPQNRGHDNVNEEATRNVFYNLSHGKNIRLFEEFFESIKPIDCSEWRNHNMFMKAFYLAKAPVVFLCAIYIPLVDYEIDKHGWSKLLNCLHIVLNPALTLMVGGAMFVDRKENVWWYTNLKLKYAQYSFIVTIPLALIVFFHSRTDVPPRYHIVFTIMNLTGSMFIIFICATEIDLVLEVVGNILDIPEDFMGVTVNAVAGALGDLVANSSMAMQGYEKMAYAAAIGGPFFTVLMATGAVLAAKIMSGMEATMDEQIGDYGENAYIFLNLGLFSALLWTSTLNFFARRSTGIFSMGIYGLYIFFAILIEQNIIHSYSRDDVFPIPE